MVAVSDQLTLDPSMAQVGFSRAIRSTRAQIGCGVGGRPGCRRGWVQRRATRWACQRSRVLGETSRSRRRCVGQQSAERAEDGAVDPGQRRAWVVSAQHGELVTEDQDLDVLGCVGSSASHQPTQHAGEQQVGESEGHSSRTQPDLRRVPWVPNSDAASAQGRVRRGSCRCRRSECVEGRSVSALLGPSVTPRCLRKPRAGGPPARWTGWSRSAMPRST